MSLFLSEHRYLRFFSFALFYIAQGLPIGLISIALPAWLAEQGAGAGQIATFIAITSLPWGFKLLAGPVMDRFSFLAMGRRRPWVIGAQFGLVFAMFSLGFVPDPVNHIFALTWMAFAVNFFGAVQDVAVDGMAIDVLPEDERGRANAFMAFGQVAGYSGSGALSAMALSIWGIQGAAALLAGGAALIFVWSVLVRERRGEKTLPWTEGNATQRSLELQADNWRSIFDNLVKVMFLPASLLLFFMTLSWRMADGFWLSVAPVIVTQELGYASTDYSYWTSLATGIAASIGLLVGPLIDRTGAQRILIFSILGYGLTCFVIGFNRDLWEFAWFPPGGMFAQAFFSQGVFISFITLHMNICWKLVSATQFAIYMAWANLSRSIGAGVYGEVQPYLESGQEFLMMGIFCLLGAGFASLVNLRSHESRINRLDALPET